MRKIIGALIIILAVAGLTSSVLAQDEIPVYVKTWASGPGSGVSQLNVPRGLEASGSKIYVSDKFNHRIQVYETDGTYFASWGGFNQPRGVAIDPSNGDVLVSNTSSNNIKRFSSTGNLLNTFGSYGTGTGYLNLPMGLAVRNGEVFVANSANHRVEVYSTSGIYLRNWGEFGSALEQFYYPRDLALDSAGNVYVLEVGTHRVQKFDSQGNFMTSWGGSGQMNQPHGIAIDGNDHVFIANTYLHRVDKYTSDGEYLLTFGSAGTLPGQFNQPTGISIAGEFIYVTDTNNHRVQKFSGAGGSLPLPPNTTPDPITSTIPEVLTSPDGSLDYNITLRNSDGDTLPDVNITLVVSSEAMDYLFWCEGQELPFINAVTDGTGTATFNIASGGCLDPTLASGPPVEIYANDSIFLGHRGIVSVDYTADGKCSMDDVILSRFGYHMANGVYSYCVDYNGDGIVNAEDYQILQYPIAYGIICPALLNPAGKEPGAGNDPRRGNSNWKEN